MIFPFRRTTLHVHPLFPGLILFCLFTGKTSVLYTVLALLVHETGHLAALWLFHKAPQKISLTPFGGLMDWPEEGTLSPAQGFVIAFSGPLFSFLGCVLSLSLFCRGFFSPEGLLSFFRSSLLLLLFNLLPALPLDGGRMLSALLSPFIPKKSLNRVLLFLGRATGMLLILLSVRFAMAGEYQFAPAFAGVYVLYACTLEGRQSPYHYYSGLIARRQRMEHQPLSVQPLAVPGSLPLHAMLPRLKENRYHLFHVVHGDGMALLGTLNEQEYCTLLMENAAITFSQALARAKKQHFPK